VTNLPAGNDARSWLRRGLLAVRTGDRAEARRCFQAARDAEPDNIIALLWLAWLAPTRGESLVLLSRVLELDPKNERARAGIRWARRRPLISEAPLDALGGDELADAGQPPATDAVATSAQGHPGRSELLRDTLRSPDVQGDAREGITAQYTRHLVGRLGLLLVAFVCLFAIGVALVAWHSPTMVLASLPRTGGILPTATPTVPPTLTFTPTPTASPTATATSTPTPTPSPTPTPTPTNTTAPTVTPTFTPSPMPPPPPPTPTPGPGAPSPSPGGEKWIDVDLTYQRVTAYEGNTPVFQGIVSTGLPNTPTVVGQFRIYWKLLASDMAGPGYYLPGVPYAMYFYRGYALHGTYWHNNFGQPMSHGCVNLRTADAQWLFNWADPPLPLGASHVKASEANPGTLVVVHY
jgi:lipoprotein-anchoring transpeptidase ErfK/SrfK